MKKRNYFPTRRCIYCGKFISYADLVDAVWHNFTSISDMEPREDEPAHKTCDDKQKQMYERAKVGM